MNQISQDDIRYNAAEGLFEARVTLHTAEGARTYACSLPGDLSMSLDAAADGLRRAALTRHLTTPGLYSAPLSGLTPTPLRAPTRTTWRRKLMDALPGIRRLRAA